MSAVPGEDAHHRTRLLVGDEAMARLHHAHVAVFGLGGVGSYAFEALVRAGIGRFCIVDADTVAPSNLNRQLVALQETIGRPKVEIAAERARAINPEAHIETQMVFVDDNNLNGLLPSDLDYAVDAIDSLESKIGLLCKLRQLGTPTVSCMGAAQRLDPTRIRVADIGQTSGCPLARRVRTALRKQGIQEGIQCVFSNASVLPNAGQLEPEFADSIERRPFGSISYVPGIIGLTAAGVVIQGLLSNP